MENHIEQSITKEFLIFGLTSENILILGFIFALGNVFLPLSILFLVLFIVGIFFAKVNKSGKRHYIQSMLVWIKMPKRLSIQQSEELPELFKG